MQDIEQINNDIPPIHQWTDEDGYVRIVKCVNRDGTSHGGFVWPKSGPVTNPHWSRDPTCDSGGLFGWAWGMGIEDGIQADTWYHVKNGTLVKEEAI